MPPKSKVNKEDVLNAAFLITKNEGFSCVNARSIAKSLNISTMPIFRVYENMEALNQELIERIYQYYRDFTSHYIKGDDELLEVSFAYVEFARKEKNLFYYVYVSDMSESRTMNETINSDYNQNIIHKMMKQYHISYDKAVTVFRDVRFYSHGIASQVLVDRTILNEEEVLELIKQAIIKFRS
ncbi:MAG: TetR/AcrR family transcriptional regulator [Erysipelotrichaceae bacterium]|nr:TetR/AcrR family transcriptional regulator [Erysipelotrichaceae bacterium]